MARAKFAKSITVPDAQLLVERIFRPLLAIYPSAELFRDALDNHARFQISWYDALIVTAAAQARCSILYSEDFQHGARIAGVRIENPFHGA